MSGVTVATALATLAAVAVLAWPARQLPGHEAGHSGGAGPAEGRATTDGVPTAATARTRTGPPATTHAVADGMSLLALALRSGMGQVEALERVSRATGGPVGRHLGAVAAALRWGRPDVEAWSYAPAVWRPAALAWRVAAASGAAPADLVEAAAGRLRAEADRRAEAGAARAGVFLVLPLGLAFLPAFACTAVVPVVLALARPALLP